MSAIESQAIRYRAHKLIALAWEDAESHVKASGGKNPPTSLEGKAASDLRTAVGFNTQRAIAAVRDARTESRQMGWAPQPQEPTDA